MNIRDVYRASTLATRGRGMNSGANVQHTHATVVSLYSVCVETIRSGFLVSRPRFSANSRSNWTQTSVALFYLHQGRDILQRSPCGVREHAGVPTVLPPSCIFTLASGSRFRDLGLGRECALWQPPSPLRCYGALTRLHKTEDYQIVRMKYVVATAEVALIIVVASSLAMLDRGMSVKDHQNDRLPYMNESNSPDLLAYGYAAFLVTPRL